MAVYRYQVVCVGMWRGKIKRWNTTLHMPSTSSTTTVKNAFQACGWPNPGDAVGDCSGGVASITIYASSGGAPISQTTYFDWQVPSTWIPYTGSAWSGVDPATPVDASGESALVVVGNMAAKSSSGKPVKTRKFLHAIPSRTETDYTLPDIDSTSLAALKLAFPVTLLSSPSGVQPSSSDIEPYYGNHQRVRGRRRTTNQVAAQAFSLGVLAGGGATTSGQGEPFPGGEY